MEILAAALLVMQGGSIHDLQLDMGKRSVEEVLGSLGTHDADWPSDGTEKYDVPGGNLFFCGNMLHTIIIDMPGNVQSFARAVNAETKARGAPEVAFEDTVVGYVNAEWRVEPYKYLSISMVQYRPDDEIEVWRSLRQLNHCKDGALQ
jgi:hypothetical protein